MLRSLRGKVSDRKLRLYNLACCERILPVLDAKPYCRHPVFQAARSLFDLLEPCAEGPTHDDELDTRLNSWMTHWDNANLRTLDEIRTERFWEGDEGLFSRWPTAQAEALCAVWIAANASYSGIEFLHDSIFTVCYHVCKALWASPQRSRPRQFALLLCDLTGNPFRRVDIDPNCLAHLPGSARSLAETIYADRSFGDLPILADALEEAGCQSPEIAFHLRAYDEHVRGCWVLDLVLGKN